MNELLKAADDAKRLLSGFKAIATVADAFEKVGQLQQAKTEAESSLATLQAAITQAKTEVAHAKTKASDLVAKGEAKADELLRAAEDAAKQMLDDAEAKRLVVTEKAEAEQSEADRKSVV